MSYNLTLPHYLMAYIGGNARRMRSLGDHKIDNNHRPQQKPESASEPQAQGHDYTITSAWINR